MFCRFSRKFLSEAKKKEFPVCYQSVNKALQVFDLASSRSSGPSHCDLNSFFMGKAEAILLSSHYPGFFISSSPPLI